MASTLPQLYTLEATPRRDVLDATEVGAPELEGSYTTIGPFVTPGGTLLLAYDKASGAVDTYAISDKAPWLNRVPNSLDLKQGKGGWDVVEPFTLGNLPYLCCYRKDDGVFAFYAVGPDLSTSDPVLFWHRRPPYTTGLTMVKPRVANGQVFVVGYDSENGYVNNWTVSVTAVSDGKLPPIDVNIAWAHQWAPNWTRFAWFTWGGQNFFLKTNTGKLNVNIDHMSSVLSAGSSEVGSHLHLDDALDLDAVHPFTIGTEGPHFLTYIKASGKTTLNKVHADCLGWTTVAQVDAPEGASLVVPYRLGDTTYALFV